MIILNSILASFNKPILMYINQYGNKLMFILVALLGIVAMLDFAMVFESSRVITYIGRNTIIVYVTHFILYRFLKGALQHIVPNIQFTAYPIYLILFFIAMLFEFPIIFLANRFIPEIFGKKRVGSIHILF